MDTSKIYIEMCDCVEIQKQWDIEDGDCTLNPEKEIEVVGWWIPAIKRFQTHHKLKDNYVAKRKKESTWLPRQDQIQEMMYSPDDQGLPYKLTTFWTWADDFLWNKSGKYKDRGYRMANYSESWEQLWLAFYMHEKHGKVWGGTKWEKK